MRRILSLVVVAVIAFAAGAAGTGAFSRLLHDPTVGGTVTSTPAAVSHAATATQASAASTPATAAPTSAPVAATATRTLPPTSAPGTPSSTPSATPVPLGAPLSLSQSGANGAALAVGGWTNSAGITMQVLGPSSLPGLRAEVEVRPVGQAFTGVATQMAPLAQGSAAIALRGLASGGYHWQARLAGPSSTGPWTSFAHDATAFNVQAEPPPAPVLSSPSNPNPDRVYGSPAITATWTAPSDPAGIAGYSYRLDTDPQGQALPAVRTQARQITLGGLASGVYYLHVRALDGAGNWGPSATYPFHIDVTPPQVTQAVFSGYYIDPALESLQLTYSLSKSAHVTLGVYNAAGVRVRHFVLPGIKPAGATNTLIWNGRDDAGKQVPAGGYDIYLRATDRFGNAHVSGWYGFTVTYKRIVVSLSQQRLWAYDGKTLVLSTLVTTGNPLLPTPTGLFHIIWTRAPFTFHSPWPKGSPFYYPPSPVKYALYFDPPGYFIHDANWRSQFGPGSNTVAGTPGGNQTGTHGCVNVPTPTMAELYAWAPAGTAVLIQQ